MKRKEVEGPKIHYKLCCGSSIFFNTKVNYNIMSELPIASHAHDFKKISLPKTTDEEIHFPTPEALERSSMNLFYSV